MDILSHALWAGAAAEVIRRRHWFTPRAFAGVVALGVAPDIAQFLPVAGWSVSQAQPGHLLYAYVTATPGTEPSMPPLVHALSHHLHCIMHSVVVLSIVSLVLGLLRPVSVWLLAGWWLHVLVDIPTHSSEYYGVPFLYPLTDWSFDGVAWTTPWVMATNIAALAAAYAALALTRSPRRLEGRRTA